MPKVSHPSIAKIQADGNRSLLVSAAIYEPSSQAKSVLDGELYCTILRKIGKRSIIGFASGTAAVTLKYTTQMITRLMTAKAAGSCPGCSSS